MFKTVTLIAALDSRNVNPRTIFDFGEPQRNAEGRIFYTYEVDGGLIYDIINKTGLVDRVQLPKGMSLAGFGKIRASRGIISAFFAGSVGRSGPTFRRSSPLPVLKR